VYEDFIYFGYNADKVEEPVLSGTNGYFVLSGMQPA
jgi:hypothetical protein